MTNKTPKILVVGAQGKMGQEALKAINETPGLVLSGTVSRGQSLAKELEKANANIMLELTGPDTVYNHSKLALEKGVSCIVGASGLNPNQVNQLQRLAEDKQLGGCIIPNFSIAATLLMLCAQRIAPFMTEAALVETHHANKKDAPSATAKHTAEMIASAKDYMNEKNILCHYQNNIPIHSVRSAGVVAQQEVFFSQAGESLSIEHTTTDRKAFMPGLIMCCQKVLQLDHLVVGMEMLIDL